jgi:hypothetical protein
MGQKRRQPFPLSFNTSLKGDFQGWRVTSDGGLIVVHEPNERLGLGELIEKNLTESRHGKNTQFPLGELFRLSVYSSPAGYNDVNDAELAKLSAGRAGWVATTAEKTCYMLAYIPNMIKQSAPAWNIADPHKLSVFCIR